MYSVQTHEPTGTDIFFNVSCECGKDKVTLPPNLGANVLPAEEDRSFNKRTPKVRRSKYALERSLSIADDFCLGLSVPIMLRINCRNIWVRIYYVYQPMGAHAQLSGIEVTVVLNSS